MLRCYSLELYEGMAQEIERRFSALAILTRFSVEFWCRFCAPFCEYRIILQRQKFVLSLSIIVWKMQQYSELLKLYFLF